MFKRDMGRLQDCLDRMDECPLGAGALAASTHPIDRFATASALGFDRPMANSLDAVSDRDYAIELLSALSILMMHLSRFSEEIILWCSWEFKFVELDDAYSTGSSIMPQKKNPDVAELVRGKTGRVYGDLVTLLAMMKSLPLAYNKDMQEDKEALFDAIDTVDMCLPVFTAMVDTMKVLPPEYAQGGQRRLYQRHRLRRLSGQEGDALPPGLHHRGQAGEPLHPDGPDSGHPAPGGVPVHLPPVQRGCV